MRVIKFRAWDITQNRWMTSDEIKNYNISEDVSRYVGVKWSQFTGLLDKNRVEIWEGDMGRLHCHENCVGILGEVRWFNDGWWIMTNRNHAGIDGEYKLRISEVVQSIDRTGEYSAFEVVNNIFEVEALYNSNLTD